MMPPLWLLKLGAVLVALALAGGYGYRHGVQRERARTDARIAEAEANARAITARRFQTIQEASDAEFVARQAAQRDAAAARAAVASLRQRAADFAAVVVPGSSDPAASCPPADDRARVLADLLGRAAARADELAEQADAARIAGQLCERAYDALTVRQ